MKKQEKGITLIALVVTIVVLLILAAVSISMLGGENGIINQAKEAKDNTEIADEKEKVEISSVSAAGKDAWGNITKDNLKEELDKNIGEGKYTLEGEGSFTVTYVDSGRSYIVEISGNVKEEGIYSVDVSEEDIAPTEIFEYEIISNAETGATSLDSLPTKEARILRIKPEYCNDFDYTSETGKEYENTNYEIVLEDGSKITDTLVIPYQVEIDGEMYKITEAKIMAAGRNDKGELYDFCFPKVKTIIFPNTIEKILTIGSEEAPTNSTISKIVLPKKLNTIETKMFFECQNLTDIEIPNSVTSIGEWAFRECSSLTNIEIPSGIPSIEDYTFYHCNSLTSIEIPSSVTSIGRYAFSGCTSLTTVNYTGTMAQWQQISIAYGNSSLTNAQIICTDGIL